MFEGRRYAQTGYGGRAIRFADKDGGVATTAYSYAMSNGDKAEMARRITAALNLTSNFSTEHMERLVSERARATEGESNG